MLKNRNWCVLLLASLVLAAGCSPAAAPSPASASPSPTTPDDCCGEAETMGYQVEELERQNAELSAWADQLAEGYGPGVWYFNPNGSNYPVFHHTPADLNLEGVAAELNQMLSEEVAPQVILGGVDESTVQVQLSDDAALTQRMGSAGAQAYLQVVVYSLASLPEIDCVEFDFVEGDHAQPGLYCR